jgi:hypothetical protein
MSDKKSLYILFPVWEGFLGLPFSSHCLFFWKGGLVPDIFTLSDCFQDVLASNRNRGCRSRVDGS